MRTPAELWNFIMDNCVIDEDGCWLWQGPLSNGGYGKIDGVYVHRFCFAQAGGDVLGLTIDHQCHNTSACDAGVECKHRRCCNPAHMRAIPAAENSAAQERTRRTHCPQGHEYTPENTYRRKSNGNRQCKRCMHDRYMKRIGAVA